LLPSLLLMNRVAILVAEDDPCDVWLLKRAFTLACIKAPAIFVQDGQEVMDYLAGVPPYDDRTANPLPGLMVLDLLMPRVSGFEVLEWMQRDARYRHIPAIAFSGLQRPTDVRRAYTLGARFFLLKASAVEQWATLLRCVAEMYGLVDKQEFETAFVRGPLLSGAERPLEPARTNVRLASTRFRIEVDQCNTGRQSPSSSRAF
jgi:CheY-like chemotaxis protein